MKSFQMKALAVAMLGLGGLVMAGSAFAACPDPAANSNQGYATPNGPWSSEVVTNATIASGAGMAGTSCSMVVAFTPSGGAVLGNSTSFVQDQSPNNEQRYRARFYVNFSGLTSAFSTAAATGETVLLMSANANLGPTGRSPSVVRIYLVGGSPMAIRFVVADSGAPTGQFKNVSAAIPTPAGVNRIEFDYNTYPGATQQSACETSSTNGSFCAWVTDGATASTETAASVKYNLLANSFDVNGVNGWTGVKFANLGIFGPNNTLQGDSTTNSSTFAFDEFDSRRQTFIGQ